MGWKFDAIIMLLVAIFLGWLIYFGMAHAQTAHPHNWIKSFNIPGSQVDCCGGADCVELPMSYAAGLSIGDTMHLPEVGRWPERDVPVRGIFPPPPDNDPDKAWACHTGCVFVWSGG